MTSARKKTIFYTIAVLAALFLADAMWLRDRYPSVKDSMAAIRKLGVPTTFEELAKGVPKEGEDAGPYYAKVNAAWRDQPQDYWLAYEKLSQFAGTYNVQEREEAADKLRPFFAPVIKGAGLPRYALVPVSPINYGAYGDQSQDVYHAQDWARLLCNMAEADQESGNLVRAFQELILAENMSRQLAGNPGMTPGLGSIEAESSVLDCIAQIARTHEDDAAVLNKLLAFIESLPPQVSLYKMSAANFVESAYVYTDPSLREPVLPHRARNPWEWIKQAVDHQVDLRQAETDMSMWHDGFASIPPSKQDWQSVIRAFSAVIAKYRGQRYYRADNTFTTWWKASRRTWGTQLANRRVLISSIRLLLIRAQTKNLPAALPNFGDDSIDPFNGYELEYRPMAGHFSLYSLGDDGIDDGGRSIKVARGKTFDIGQSF